VSALDLNGSVFLSLVLMDHGDAAAAHGVVELAQQKVFPHAV
jgi:hypothetical protein